MIDVRYDIDKVKEQESRNHFLVEIENKFELLLNTIDEKTPCEELWHQTKDTYITCADTTLAKRKARNLSLGSAKKKH